MQQARMKWWFTSTRLRWTFSLAWSSAPVEFASDYISSCAAVFRSSVPRPGQVQLPSCQAIQSRPAVDLPDETREMTSIYLGPAPSTPEPPLFSRH
ncbi:unnamed protein product [Diplocarpon coronariae]